MALTSKTLNLTLNEQDIVTCALGTEGSVHGLVFGNRHASQSVAFGLKLFKAGTGQTIHLANKNVAAGDFYAYPKPINLEAGDRVIAWANQNDMLSVVASYYSTNDVDVQIAVGMEPKGVYSASATYNKNDLVYNAEPGFPADDGTYMSRIDGNVGNNPRTTPSAWQKVAMKGQGAFFIPTGEWDSTKNYSPNDVVTRKGSTFVCVSSNINSVPAIDSTNPNWICLYQTTAEPVETVPYAAALNLDAAAATNFFVDATGNPTIDIINPPPTGKYKVLTLIFKHNGAPRSITWNAKIKWTDNSAPLTATTANAIDVFTFWTIDGGATWNGSLSWWSNS